MTYEANVPIETHLCSLQSKINWEQALISPYKTKNVMIALCKKTKKIIIDFQHTSVVSQAKEPYSDRKSVV